MKLKSLLGLARRTDASSAELRESLASAEATLAAAAADKDAAQADYRDSLLDDDLGRAVRAQARVAETTVAHDRAAMLVDVLREKMARAETAEAEATRRQRYDEARKMRDAVADRLTTEYPKFAQAIAGLIRDIAKAETLVEAANADLPAGAERLAMAETVARDVPALPRQDISERIVRRWVFPETGAVLSDQQASRVEGHGRTGRIPGDQWSTDKRVEAREFREVTYHPAARTGWHYPLRENVRLPGLQAGSPSIWPAGLEAPAPAVVARPVEIEYVPVEASTAVDDQAVSREASQQEVEISPRRERASRRSGK